MIGAKLPFVLADWEGLAERPGLVRQRQDDRLRPGRRLFRRRAGEGGAGRPGEDRRQLRRAGGGGRGDRPAGLLRRGLLLRDRHDVCPGASTSATASAATPPSSTSRPSTWRPPLAWLLLRRGLLRGQLIKLYIIAYLIYRFLTEFIRPEPVSGSA